MKKIYCLLAAAILAVGCTEDVTTDDIVVNNEANCDYIEVVADIELDEDSRTTLIDEGQGGKVIWSEGDTIGAVAADGTITECAPTSIDGSSAIFSVPEKTLYAIYPYSSATTFTDNKLNHTLVSNITLDGSAKVFGDKQNVMVAKNMGGKLSFKHLCGYIEVKLKGTGTVKHVALRSNTRKWDAMSGLGTIDLSDESNPKFTADAGHKKAFNWLYATCSNVELSKDKATSFYFIVPPRTYENLSICVQTDKGSYAISSNNAIVVNRAKIRPIAAIDIDTLKPATATDLSAEGLANCYVVPQSSEAKEYSFPAQKLNATEKLANVAYAHLMWSDRAGLISNVNYDAATGTVSLKYAGGNKEGNAMVSVFDANNNALWTWHIWCTDQPAVVRVKNNLTPTDQTHGIMDRNLGATYAPKTPGEAVNISAENATNSLGLYYQYGRPIPFPKPTSITNTTDESSLFGDTSDFELMYGFKDNLQCFQYTNYGNALNTMLQHPLIYGVVYTDKYGAATSATSGTYTAFCKDLPIPCIKSSQLWHSENMHVVSAKGDTDPCPPGYCIEEFDTFKSALYNVPQNRVSQGDQTSNKTYGYYYECPISRDIAWFPANGYRTEKGVYSTVGDVLNMWSMRKCTYDWLYGIKWYTTSTTGDTQKIVTTGFNSLAQGFNVRCRVMDRTDLQAKIEKPEFETGSDNKLSILFVGNSLTQDGIAYLPYMLKNYYPEIDFKIYMWYTGGYTLGQHYSTFTSSGTAGIFSVAENSEKWTNYNGSMTMASVLANYKFDIVCMQEYFNYKTSYTDCTDWNNCRNYIVKNYKGGNDLKFISLFHAPLRKEGATADVHTVYQRTADGNAFIYKNTVSEDMIPFGIAVYNALKTDLNNLGDLGQLTPDGTHTQEGLPCLLQTYVALEWIFDRWNIEKTVLGNPFRMTTEIYNKISVPGANLGSGVVTGTDAQYKLAQEIAIAAYAEGKELLKDSLK